MKNCNCKADFIAAWKRDNTNPLAKLNEDEIIMKCDVVVFGSDSYGAVTATVWDCVQQRFIRYEQAEYRRLKGLGLVP